MRRHAIRADLYQLITNAGNVLKASLFSIPAGGQEEYVLSYETVIQHEGEHLEGAADLKGWQG